MPDVAVARRGMTRSHPPGQGARLVDGGVQYRTWAQHDSVETLIRNAAGETLRVIELTPEADGYFSGIDADGRAGDLYRYRLNRVADWPDPASRFQPFGVHGPSAVVDAKSFRWSDQDWIVPSFSELVIYELHIGAFTPEGTFASAIQKLDHLVSLGINAIELMPIADFAGDRNWGYDGVMLYAPARAYGQPDDLRALVDAAHARGQAVVLDVVYNHLGPDGNYLGCYHPNYSNAKHRTPWGAGLNFETPPVRELFSENAPYWMREFHIDGFRLDATHAILDESPQHILAEVAERVHDLGGFVIAEDDRNDPALLARPARGGLGFDGAWADDFHHVVRVLLTGEREAYYANFSGTPDELARTLTNGWLFCGQHQPTTGRARGGDPSELLPPQFIYCISNHDQIGNRAFGERLNHLVSAQAYRAASALLCLVPQTPMLFMGQEFGASSPFQFFNNHTPELAQKIAEGRRREFGQFAAFRDPDLRGTIPDPHAETTFRNSNLRWHELLEPQHAQVLRLYQEFLGIRRTHPVFRERARENWRATTLEDGIVAIVFSAAGRATCLLLVDLIGGHKMPDLDGSGIAPEAGRQWQALLSSNELRFGGDNVPAFSSPTTLLLQAV